jgi:hypothetical protein
VRGATDDVALALVGKVARLGELIRDVGNATHVLTRVGRGVATALSVGGRAGCRDRRIVGATLIFPHSIALSVALSVLALSVLALFAVLRRCDAVVFAVLRRCDARGREYEAETQETVNEEPHVVPPFQFCYLP